MDDVRTVIAVVREDDRFSGVREAAIRRARAVGATLILYDLDAATSPLESPLPTEWSAEGTEEDVSDRLGPDELEAAGRADLANHVRAARDRGVDAWGWLPSSDDRDVLLGYAADQPGALVLVADGQDDLDVAGLPEAETVPARRHAG